MVPAMVLVADGSNDPTRMDALNELANAAAARNEVEVIPAFDGDAAALIEELERSVIAVPAFLAGEDTASAHQFATLDLDNRFDSFAVEPLGAAPSIVAHLVRRLESAGWRRGEAVVLAVDGVTDAEERTEVELAARMLRRHAEAPVQVGYVRASDPSALDAVERMRRDGRDRVAVAPWRLVGGTDHALLREVGATAVADPLWPADFVVEALLAQHRAAATRLRA
ncbi:cobalamin biosynthesis protein CbiX [Spiractinospora alimapuensis]|nr:CbiX/SirB N-terminal domain-containing protein [Spiractinospora alimapuensis]QVQ54277.1 cobalamin biosynthesis protein CbiX [Spiractinospora alimapuensis]